MSEARSIAQSIIDREGQRALIKDATGKIVMRLYGTLDYCNAQAAKFITDKQTVELAPFCGVCETYHTPEERPSCQSA